MSMALLIFSFLSNITIKRCNEHGQQVSVSPRILTHCLSNITQLSLGDRFRCFIDDTWWPGTVVKHEPFDPRHETSPFQCYVIRWDNGESEERLSPWDIFDFSETGEYTAVQANDRTDVSCSD
jgi:hypothetical protein